MPHLLENTLNKISNWSSFFSQLFNNKVKQFQEQNTNLLHGKGLSDPKNYTYKTSMLYLSYFLQKSNINDDKLASGSYIPVHYKYLSCKYEYVCKAC